MSENKVDVNISADVGDLQSGLNKAAQAVEDAINKMAAAKAIKLEIDLDHVKTQMTAVKRIVETGISGIAKSIKLDVDSTSVSADVSAVKTQIESAVAGSSVDLKIKFDFEESQLRAEITRAQHILSTAFATGTNITIGIDLTAFRASIGTADTALRGVVTNYGTGHYEINIMINRGLLRAQLAAAERLVRAAVARISALASSITISVNIDGAVQDLIRALNELRDEVRLLRLRMSSGGGGGGGGGGGFGSSFFGNLASEFAYAAIYAVGQLGAKLVEASDDAALLNARFTDLLGTTEAVKVAKEQLFTAANRLQVPYADMSKAAARALPALMDMGKTQSEATSDSIRLSEILMTTAKLSGASTQEAASSAQQFSQALGSGVLNGDELKSILENNQALARNLAAALKLPNSDIKVTIGMLRDLGSEGKITSQVLATALLNSYDRIMAKADDLPKTFSGTWATVKNVMFMAVDQMNEKQVFAGAIDGLSSFGKKLAELSKDGTLVEWGQGITDVLGAVAGAFMGLLEVVGEILGEIGSLWSDLTGGIESGTGVQVSAWAMLSGAIKAFHAVFIGLRVGVKIIMEAIKWVVKDAIAVMIAAWLTLKTAVVSVVLTIRTFVEVLIQLLQTLASVAIYALHLDFSGAKQAWSDGIAELEEISKKGNQRIVDNAEQAGRDLTAAWQTSGTGGGENADAIAKTAREAGDKLAGLYSNDSASSKPKKPKPEFGEIEKTAVGAGKPKKEKSQMKDFDAGLDAEKNQWERKNAANGSLQEFPIEKVVDYWAKVLSTEKMTADDRVKVEKKLLDAKRDIRQRDYDETQRNIESQLNAYANNYAKRIKLQNDLVLHAELAYGKESKQAMQAQEALNKLKRDASRSDLDLLSDAVDAREKFALEDVEINAAALQRQYDAGLVTHRDMLAAEAAFEQQRYKIKSQALDDRLALWERENTLTNGDADPKKRQTLIDDKASLDKGNADSTAASNQAQALEGMDRYFGGLSDRMSSLWDRGLQSMLDGTLQWKQAMETMWSDLGMFFLKKLVTDPMRDWLLMQGKKLAMQLFYKKAEVATEAAGEAAKTGAVAAGEAARTGFTFMGFMSRIGIAVMEAIKTIAIYAWQAMAGAYAALAGIPIIGPIIAPIAAAATFAGVIGLAGKIKSASGGYDIPAGVNPMTQLHAEEMVLPAKYANAVRDMANGGQSSGGAQGGGGDTINVNINALDARSMVRLMKDNRNGLAAAVSAGVREFKGAKP